MHLLYSRDYILIWTTCYDLISTFLRKIYDSNTNGAFRLGFYNFLGYLHNNKKLLKKQIKSLLVGSSLSDPYRSESMTSINWIWIFIIYRSNVLFYTDRHDFCNNNKTVSSITWKRFKLGRYFLIYVFAILKRNK